MSFPLPAPHPYVLPSESVTITDLWHSHCHHPHRYGQPPKAEPYELRLRPTEIRQHFINVLGEQMLPNQAVHGSVQHLILSARVTFCLVCGYLSMYVAGGVALFRDWSVMGVA